MLATADTSQDPIGPCALLEHLLDCFKHSTMATLSSSLDVGAHTVVGYCRGCTVGVRVTAGLIFS